MKTLLKFIIRNFAAYKLATFLTANYFVPGSWSYVLANIGVMFLTYELLRFAFETKVADLVFKGVKVGEHREDE